MSMPSKATSKKIIFDSGCGIGTSTRKLSNKYPDCFIIGIDKSESRIKNLFVMKKRWMKIFV